MAKQVYSNRSRIHTVYKNKEGKRLPGVTTILNELAKPALIHWAWGLGTKGIDYRVHRDELADIGSLTHDMILCHLKGEKWDNSEYSKKQIDKAENCFLSYLEWEKQHNLEPGLLETPLVSEIHQYGGKPDFYGRIDGTLTLLDFKTGKRLYDEHLFQLAGYSQLLQENNYKVEQSMLLNIGRDETEKFEQLKKVDLSLESIIFFAALEIYRAKKLLKKGEE